MEPHLPELPPDVVPAVKRRVRWGLMHVALMIFFCDALACIWPQFEVHWKIVSRVGVAIAAFFATFAEYFHDEEIEAEVHQKDLKDEKESKHDL